LKNKREIKAIQQSDLPDGLINRLSATWAITGENFMTSLLVNYISEALDELDTDEGRDMAVRQAIKAAYYFLRDYDNNYEKLRKEYEN
jgi:hypothetical protein